MRHSNWALAITMLVIGLSLTTTNIYADSTGASSPTLAEATVASINDFGSRTSAFTSNNVRATGQLGDDQAYGGFGLSIPAGSTINGITVSLEGRRDTANLCGISVGTPTFSVRLSDPTLVGSPTGLGSFVGTIQTTTSYSSPADSIKILGGTTDTWGNTYTATQLSNLWVLVTANCGLTIFPITSNMQLDHLTVDVDYTLPDTTIPVITLLGDAVVEIPYGSVYVDAGATALDDVDGDITGSIVTGGLPINTFVALATYTITYDVEDSSGNDAVQVTRTVKIGKKAGDESVWDTRPTFGMNPVKQDELIVKCGFGMDQTCFDMTDIWHTPFDKIVISTGETHNFQLNILAQHRLKDAGFCLVPAVGSMEGELCIGASLDGNGVITGTTVNQKEGLVDESLIKISTTRDGAYYNIKIDGVKFLDQPYYEVIGLYAVDWQPLATNQFLNEGIDVIGKSYLPPVVTSIPTHEKSKYGESAMITLTRVDKFENVWATEDGILYTFNSYGTPEKLSPDVVTRISDQTQSVMTRTNSNFKLLVDWSTEQAEQKMRQMYPNLFKEPKFAEINNIFSHNDPYINSKKILADSLFK